MENFDFDFDKQLTPLLEPLILQSLNMLENILDSGGDDSIGEVSGLLNDLEKDFGEYKDMLSSNIHDKITSIKYKISQFNTVFDSQKDNLE